MEDKHTRQKQLAARIAESADEEERRVLLDWAKGLVEIRESSLPARQKAVAALKLTKDSKVAIKVAKMVAKEIKRHSWDDRGWKGRGLLWGSAIGIAVFGGQGAGIAALGTAIGVPLWVVLGAGGLFIGELIELLQEKLGAAESRPTTTYTEIEAKKTSDSQEVLKKDEE